MSKLLNEVIHKNFTNLHKLHERFYCSYLPSTQTVLIKSKNRKEDNNLKTVKFPERDEEFRVNDVNIQMISKNIYEQLFGKLNTSLDPQLIKSCQEHLLHHGIDFRDCDRLPDVQLKLPDLVGGNIVEHFQNIGETQCAPYRELLEKLARSKIPPVPKRWLKTAGWHRYSGDGAPQPVPCPPDDALILDVEVLMSAGKRPTLACALSPDAWYAWISEPLANGDKHEYFDNIDYNSLIPLETDGIQPCGDLQRPRIVVGHNVSYDRTKVKEQYWINRTGVRFMDTMSMHTCVSGVTSYQRAVLKTKDKSPDPSDDAWMDISSLNSLSDVHNLYCGSPIDKETRDIFMEGTIQDVHDNFQRLVTYCASDVSATLNVLKELLPLFLERFPHPVTMAGMLELGSAYLPVNSNWLQYLESAETVFEDLKLETRQLLSIKADEACRLMINEEYKKDLWMWDQDWSTQELKLKKQKPTKKAKDDAKIDRNMDSIPDIICEETESNTKLDKTQILTKEYIKEINKSPVNMSKNYNVESLMEKFNYLYEIKHRLPVRKPYLAGYPAWYRKLCVKPGKDPDWLPGANNITTSMQITPKLLRLTWEGYPLHHLQSEGWGFLVPFSRRRPETYECVEGEPQLPLEELVAKCPVVDHGKDKNEEFSNAALHRISKSVEEDMGRRSYYARKTLDEKALANKYHGLGVWCGVEIQGCCHFLRLPHKDGPKYKVGNPLAKDFLDMFSQNVLAAQGDEAEKVLNFGRMMSYWRNNRERIMGQQVVWLPPEHLPGHLRGDVRLYGAIVPQVVVCGTLTRRASEPTWMTASNAHKERIGSELRAMVQAPPGYKFVGADVDSQELWIASLLGDSTVGIAGGTALGWSVLAGSKQNNTDLHSLTARASGISRDHAKVINYARIYGAGQNFAERLLKQFNPTMTNAEAKSKAIKMFTTTKGRRVYQLKKQYMEGFMDEDLEDQAVEMTSYQAMRLAKMSNKSLEDMFERPKWVGGTESEMFNKLEEIADSAGPSTAFLSGRLSRALEHSSGRWASTRLNWAVQSAAADFLHLMLVTMRWLAPTDTRFCLSFHDEVRYLVPEEHKYETALALQITNLLTRAFCSKRVGMNDLPLSVAFFTSVEVDQVLRKESNVSCSTPSNPHGLEKGYGIPSGESLNITQLLHKCHLNKDIK